MKPGLRTHRGLLVALLVIGAAALPRPATAANPAHGNGTKVIPTEMGYGALVVRVTEAVAANRMGLVAQASATLGAKSIGGDIPGNMVIMVFRPDFAVRMLKASVPAGIEAPIRLYVTEDAKSGRATLSYRTPSSVFAPYGNAEIDRMAGELDVIFAKIAADATK